LKVRLEDIPPEGLDLSFEESGWRPGDLGPQVAQVLGPPQARVHLERRGELVQVNGSYAVRLLLECSRCLRPVELELTGPLNMVYQPQPQGIGGEELELADDDLEVSFYSGEEIDLSGGLHDEVSLALPMAPVCRSDCPGICPICGKSRLEGRCRCRREEIDPRWAKLAELKKD
jgi:uncharacterized protein